MSQGIESRESNDLRKALERLQATFEVISDRFRELRRERKLLEERIGEMETERSLAAEHAAAQITAALQDRKALTALEEKMVLAERKHEELYGKISELEGMVEERDRMIADQEDALARLTSEHSEGKRKEEERQELEAKLGEQLRSFREKFERARDEAEQYRTRLETLESEKGSAVSSEELDTTRAELATAQQQVLALKTERVELQEKHLQLIGKLDAATRDTAMARTRVAELQKLEPKLDALHKELSKAKEGGDVVLEGGERREIADQLASAIEMIDRHLQDGEVAA